VSGQFVYESKSGAECFSCDKHDEVRLIAMSDQYSTSYDLDQLRGVTRCEKGFLLLEHILSLVIVGILSLALISLLQVVSAFHVNQSVLTQHEVNTLGIRLQNEAQFATSISVAENQLLLHFDQTGDVVSFVVRNGRLVRQVNGSGGEIASYDVQRLEVMLFGDQSARLSLISVGGEVFNVYVSVLRLDVDIGGVNHEE